MVPRVCTSSAMSLLRRSRNRMRNCSRSSKAIAERRYDRTVDIAASTGRFLTSLCEVLERSRLDDLDLGHDSICYAFDFHQPFTRRGHGFGEGTEARKDLLRQGFTSLRGIARKRINSMSS